MGHTIECVGRPDPRNSTLELVALVQRAALRQASWGDFGQQLAQQLGGVVGLIGIPSPGHAMFAWPASNGCEGSARPAPSSFSLVSAARDLAPGEARRIDELLSPELAVAVLGANQAEFGSVSPRRSWVLRIGKKEPPALLLALWPRVGRSQLQRGLEELSLLADPLDQALETAARLDQVEAMQSGLRAIVDRLRVGVILVQRGGRVVLTNVAADAVLREGDALELTPDGLRGATSASTAELQALVKTCTSNGAAGQAAATLLPRLSRRQPLHVLARSLGSDPHSLVAILIQDPDHVPELRGELLQRLFDLTPAEAALARLLAQGRDLHEVAEILGLTLHTVRSRLRDVFLKTGTSRQAALVERLLASPAVLDAIH